MSHRSLLVFPDDTSKSIVEAIHNAKKLLRIKMFIFSDPELIQAVIDAHGRGVEVKIMLNPARRTGEQENEETRATLEAVGIEVRDSSPSFGITHEKSLVVDDEVAFIQSLNWEIKDLTLTRDFAIVTSHKHEVEEVIAGFEADWQREDFDPGAEAHLIWCKGNGRERMAKLIDSARHTLFVQNERYQDPVIIEHLLRAAMRGVKVHVLAKPAHSLKQGKLGEGVGSLRMMDDVGIKIHKLKGLKLHGKMILADGERAIIGSINLAPGSFDDRRELAIEVHDEEIVGRLHKVAKEDWEDSHKLDLSDEGIFADLEKHNEGSSSELALDVGEKEAEHHKHHDK
ncbi:MAG: phospholipase D-like domain-containing protein [Luteolibacter sp.]|uniref:phospholipase D-like domain-containing protein n=1 Tax=Luteolibacter sp. TaxID=1962973 RepID=UPI003265BBBD